MDALAIARVFHVLGVVIWIGGVGMVTTVILPAQHPSADQRIRVFEAIESRFAWVARLMTLLVGFSGLYMTWKLNLWTDFSNCLIGGCTRWFASGHFLPLCFF
jgi:uncharacterized membrane protein